MSPIGARRAKASGRGVRIIPAFVEDASVAVVTRERLEITAL